VIANLLKRNEGGLNTSNTVITGGQKHKQLEIREMNVKKKEDSLKGRNRK
jgi:hypothetical protein